MYLFLVKELQERIYLFNYIVLYEFATKCKFDSSSLDFEFLISPVIAENSASWWKR